MRNSILLTLGGFALLVAGQASASTSTFNFTTASSDTEGGITATAYAFEATGNASGPTTLIYGPTSTGNNAPSVQVYTGNGLGICEGSNQNSDADDCSQPNHQVDNSTNTTTTVASGSTYDYEFMLFQFSTAVNLSQIQLGNWGTTGSGSADPFLATYWTSGSSATLSSMETALEATTVGGVAGANGFSVVQQATCSTGVATLGATTNGNGSTYNDNCAVNGNGVDSLTGSSVTYLLIGASTQSANIGNDFFKIQDLKVTTTPEPSTFVLLGIAIILLGMMARKRKLI